MSSEFLVLVLCLLFAVVATVAVLHRARRLPGTDWYRLPGAAFAAEQALRKERYAVARENARRVTTTVVAAAGASLAREWQQPSEGIAHQVVSDAQASVASMVRRLDARDRGIAALTIVLYGRTKAGKSSLFAALSGTGFDGIGDGHQNFTREIRSADLGSVRLVDAPGVDGVGSQRLEEMTIDAVHEADIVVVQVTDDAVFAEDFDRLSALGLSARPVIAALNVKQANLERLADEPDKVFRQRRLSPHIARLRKALPNRSGEPTPIVVYHALGAERARRARWKRDLALWEGSRIGDVIDALCAAGSEAREFALTSADEAVVGTGDELVTTCAEAGDEADACIDGCRSTIGEIEGILRETEGRKRFGAELADKHFALAERELLEALELTDADQFRVRADKVMNAAALSDGFKQALDEEAELLHEKFADFQGDVRLASRTSASRDGLDELHVEFQRERMIRDAAKRKARNRRLWRVGARVASALAAFAVSETAIGSAVVVSASYAAIEKLLPEIEVPSDDPASRVAGIRELVDRSSREAATAYESALEVQILAPARNQLLVPLRRQLAELGDLREAIDDLRARVEEIRQESAHRRDPTPDKEQLPA